MTSGKYMHNNPWDLLVFQKVNSGHRLQDDYDANVTSSSFFSLSPSTPSPLRNILCTGLYCFITEITVSFVKIQNSLLNWRKPIFLKKNWELFVIKMANGVNVGKTQSYVYSISIRSEKSFWLLYNTACIRIQKVYSRIGAILFDAL